MSIKNASKGSGPARRLGSRHTKASFERLVDLAYETFGDADRWQDFLRELCGALDGHSPALIVGTLAGTGPVPKVTWGVDAAYAAKWDAYYRGFDRLRDAHARMEPGAVFTSQDATPDAVYLRSEFYNDWARPQDIRHGIVAVLHRGQVPDALALCRSHRQDPFGRDDVAFLRRLVPHVQRALQGLIRAETGLAERHRLAFALDQLRTAVIVVSGDGRIRFANAAAEALLQARDVLGTAGMRIMVTDASGGDRLRAAIRAAVSPERGRARRGSSLALRRRSSRRPALITVLPVSRTRVEASGDAEAVLFIEDPEQRISKDVGWLRDMFGLTQSEARVVARLGDGASVSEIAREAGVQANSVRFHLKRALQKTETRRQAELVRLVRDAAIVRRI